MIFLVLFEMGLIVGASERYVQDRTLGARRWQAWLSPRFQGVLEIFGTMSGVSGFGNV